MLSLKFDILPFNKFSPLNVSFLSPADLCFYRTPFRHKLHKSRAKTCLLQTTRYISPPIHTHTQSCSTDLTIMRWLSLRVGVSIVVWVIVVVVSGSVPNHIQAADVRAPLDRHNAPPPRKVANLAYPVTTAATLSTDHLWTSPCRPERDGYFGGTSSASSPTSLVVQYAFALTTLPQDSGNLAPALDAIRQRVTDAVVSTAFPAVCSATNRDLVSSFSNKTTLAQLGITGFHFVPDYDAIGT
jgi:hypothetical protein